MMNDSFHKAGGHNITANYLLVMLFSLIVTACGGGSSNDAEPNTNDLNNAATDSGTQNGTDTGSDNPSNMNASTGAENGVNSNPDAGSDTGTPTSSSANTGTDDGGSTDVGGNTGTGTGISGGNISFLGNITLGQGGQFGSAVFLASDQSVTSAQIQNNFIPGSDSCQIFENTTSINADIITPNGLQEFNFNQVSAGEVITLTSSAGSYAELVKSEENGSIFYTVAGGGNLPGAIPSGTTIDIPGDVYPAFSNVAVPNVAALTYVTSSTGAKLTANSSITWDASSGAGSTMRLNASSTILPDFSDPSPNPEDFSITTTSVNCNILDDGSFSFPADIVSQLGDGFMAENFNLSRDAFTFEQSGNALLIVNVSSSN